MVIIVTIVLRHGNAFLALVITQSLWHHDAGQARLRANTRSKFQNQHLEKARLKLFMSYWTSVSLCWPASCRHQRIINSAERSFILDIPVSFFMLSDRLERESRKIEILYLEAKLQLKPATVRFAGLPRFLRLSSWLFPLWLLLNSLTEEPKTVTISCDWINFWNSEISEVRYI